MQKEIASTNQIFHRRQPCSDMNILAYDGSLDGFFTAVFETYEYKLSDVSIVRENVANISMFGDCRKVITVDIKATRVMRKLQQLISQKSFRQLYKTFLSEANDVENSMFRYIKYVLDSKGTAEHHYTHPDVMQVQQLSRKVDKEKHRMEAFVRFQLTKDGLYYAIIQPDHNVLPLIVKHFQARYADQRWLIYDALRKYGIYYDLKMVTEVQLNFGIDLQSADALEGIYDEKESLYQTLWQQYFQNVNIAARKNTKLHIQHMPKRYWRYLVEKKYMPDISE